MLFSCSEPELNKLVHNLTGGNKKFWYRYNKDTSKHYGLGYCIINDTTFIRYYIHNDSGKNTRIILNSPPIFSKPIWKFVNDSVLMFGENEYYRIILINDNNLILQSVNDSANNFLKLHKEYDQSSPILPR